MDKIPSEVGAFDSDDSDNAVANTAQPGEGREQEWMSEIKTNVKIVLKRASAILSKTAVWAVVGRLLVSAYFLNAVIEQVEEWFMLKDSPPSQPRFPDEPPTAHYFPYIPVFLVLPSALMAAGNLLLPVSATALASYTFYSDVTVWMHGYSVIRFGSWPTELLVKPLAVLGAVLLMLAHAFKESRVVRSYAGLLLSESHPPAPKPGLSKSFALLVARLMMAVLFIIFGINQARRIAARGMALHVPPGAHHHWGMPDAHDNSWQILELLVAVPFVLGVKAKASSWVLIALIFIETFTCWNWFLPLSTEAWPSWHFRSHIRSHFFVNLSMVGGLLMLQSFGHGSFIVDELIEKKAS